MRSIFFLFLCSLLPAAVSSQTAVHDAALPTDSLSRPVLLVFSGSDWCQPCIRFEKKVLTDEAFRQFAGTHLTLEKADFPQRKKLPPDQVRRNEQLAAQYNPEGLFPHVVLLRPDRTLLAVLPTDADSGAEFLRVLKTWLAN